MGRQSYGNHSTYVERPTAADGFNNPFDSGIDG
jgi:hypothetical protein